MHEIMKQMYYHQTSQITDIYYSFDLQFWIFWLFHNIFRAAFEREDGCRFYTLIAILCATKLLHVIYIMIYMNLISFSFKERENFMF